MSSADILSYVVTTTLGGVAGFAAGIGAFKTRLALSEQAAVTQRRNDEERFERIERRQMITLEILADIARATGADKRLGDALMQFIAEREV